MKFKFLAGASFAALVSFGTNAYAADVVMNEPPAPEAVAPMFTWTGGYVGVNLGGGFGKFKHPLEVTDPTTTPPTVLGSGSLDITAGGFLGGVQAGYNWQQENFVYGVEADFQGSAVKAEDTIDVTGIGSLDGGTKVDWFGTVRARIGYTPVERFMVYGTGGLAYGHVKSYINGLGIDESASKTKAGWTVGAGAEYAFTNNWTLKSEYLYTDLGKTTLIDDDFGADHVTLKNDVAFHTVRVGINYKF